MDGAVIDPAIGPYGFATFDCIQRGSELATIESLGKAVSAMQSAHLQSVHLQSTCKTDRICKWNWL